ncbi:MAG TPA: VOC family protein [Pyrinomonadaceae bacterium]|nr:VOC family protein [Pyrinomonadaceae bacterium]
MPDIPKLYRVILQVSDLDQGAEFYSKLLGTEGRRIRGGFRHYFDCGAVILALVDPSADDEKARPNSDNIYFSVVELETFHSRARELDCLSTGDVHGAPAGEIVLRPWGERSFYAFDPFGNPICFVEDSTVFTGR